MASHTSPFPLLPRAPQGEAGGPKHHLPECRLEHPGATAEPCVEVRSHLPQEGDLMRVGTGHGDAQWAQQSGGVPFCVWGKLRPEVSRDSTAEGENVLGSQSQLEWARPGGVYSLSGLWGVCPPVPQFPVPKREHLPGWITQGGWSLGS